MKHAVKIALIGATLAVAGCGDRFGSGGSGAGADRFGTSPAGAPSDPASPAYFQQTVGDRVLFTVNEDTLSPEARQILDGQARWLLDNPDYTVRIEGHADERGTTEYNIALGASRASRVQEYLFTQGVAIRRLDTVSFGKERPIEICSEESCYAQNRRAVTVLTTGAGL